MKSEHVLLGKMLYDAEKAGIHWYAIQLDNGCRGIVDDFLPNIILVICIACALFACLVFDTFGDQVSYRLAAIPGILVLIFPLGILLLNSYCLRLVNWNKKNNNVIDSVESNDHIELQVRNTQTDIQNPILQ